MAAADIKHLWELCGNRGWLDLRRDVLDAHLKLPFVATPWNFTAAAAELDKMIAERRIHWMSLWIDQTVATGTSWAEIVSVLKTWFAERRSFDALQAIATALAYRGSRQDLSALHIYDGMPESASKQVIADTEFAVRRRTVH